jgi:hypothetical protein
VESQSRCITYAFAIAKVFVFFLGRYWTIYLSWTPRWKLCFYIGGIEERVLARVVRVSRGH